MLHHCLSNTPRLGWLPFPSVSLACLARQPAAGGTNMVPPSLTTSKAHPVASRNEQLAWEQALGVADADQPSCASPQPQLPAGSMPTSHPATGATAEECLAWEQALGGARAAPDSAEHHAGHPPVYAVVECGSHSTRLLLSTGSSDICRLSLDTHLGAALQQPWASPSRPDQQQQTATAAATLAAVRDYQQLIDQHQQHLRGGIAAVATAAVRETPEGPSIAAAVGAILQCPVRILTGDEEARLAFKGATCGLDSSSSGGGMCGRLCLVVDMGGRSTELAIGAADGVPVATASIPLGCLSIQQALLSSTAATVVAAAEASDPASGSSVAAAAPLMQAAGSILDAHAAQLEQVLAVVRGTQAQGGGAGEGAEQQAPSVTVIATGGTATTLAALQLCLPEYTHAAVHMSVLRKQQIEGLMQQCCLLTPDQQQQQQRGSGWPVWLTAARAATLPAGCAGLLVLLARLGVDEVLVSDSDLLDGVLAELCAADKGMSPSDCVGSQV